MKASNRYLYRLAIEIRGIRCIPEIAVYGGHLHRDDRAAIVPVMRCFILLFPIALCCANKIISAAADARTPLEIASRVNRISGRAQAYRIYRSTAIMSRVVSCREWQNDISPKQRGVQFDKDYDQASSFARAILKRYGAVALSNRRVQTPRGRQSSLPKPRYRPPRREMSRPLKFGATISALSKRRMKARR